jgi:hypothetical protein
MVVQNEHVVSVYGKVGKREEPAGHLNLIPAVDPRDWVEDKFKLAYL